MVCCDLLFLSKTEGGASGGIWVSLRLIGRLGYLFLALLVELLDKLRLLVYQLRSHDFTELEVEDLEEGFTLLAYSRVRVT